MSGVFQTFSCSISYKAVVVAVIVVCSQIRNRWRYDRLGVMVWAGTVFINVQGMLFLIIAFFTEATFLLNV